jgi:hypothetical protein
MDETNQELFPPKPSQTIAWWSGSLETFKRETPDAIADRLSYKAIENFRTNEQNAQISWHETIGILRHALIDLPGHWQLLLEYPLLRLNARLDAVLVTERAIFVIEFKTLDQKFNPAARVQAEDYALDLQDFHAGSRHEIIVPVVVASFGNPSPTQWTFPLPGVTAVYETLPKNLAELLQDLHRKFVASIPEGTIDIGAWEQQPYRPVPSIIEAARRLYQKHGVADIKSARADTDNLTRTTNAILDAISAAKRNKKFIILFVTGIPGAGKTLCGLNAVFSAETDATFLTGTLPMVYVLNAALALDATKDKDKSSRFAKRETKSKIQSITGFLKNYILKQYDLPEHVIVFDEAQRAWDAKQGAKPPFRLPTSEASIVLDIMHRHHDYAVIVGLVGNGQEINTGEAGLAEWGRALAERPDWQIRAAPGVLETNDPRQKLFPTQPPNMAIDDCLHLNFAIRNVITSSAALWVDAVLRGQIAEAKTHAGQDLPFFITRSLQDMRHGLRTMARGQRRAGLVCSSGAKRLVADGIWPNFEHLNKDKVANWFLKKWPDVRASDALEIPTTEFACQGLELDYVGLCWGGDLTWTGKWTVRNFKGTQWQTRAAGNAADYQINTYRVLLTRARSSTIIWVPDGDQNDETRHPAEFDGVANFLIACGARPLQEPASATGDGTAESLFA